MNVYLFLLVLGLLTVLVIIGLITAKIALDVIVKGIVDDEVIDTSADWKRNSNNEVVPDDLKLKDNGG